MGMCSSILAEDLQQICSNEYIPWEKLYGQTILVTGATGLIGGNLVDALLWANRQRQLGLTVIALVRNKEAAVVRFTQHGQMDQALLLLEGDVCLLPDIPLPVDYIIHGASPTASAYFAQHPLETVRTSVLGTWNLLEFAKEKHAKGFLYLSSMEVYGAHKSDEAIDEQGCAAIDTMAVRSCYPEAKRLCENLCAGCFFEYGLPTEVIRLAQTFGPGVAVNDQRVFMQFTRAALKKENILLRTDGSSKRSCLYTADAVSAILTVLLCGKPGEAYNAANPDTYCSILEMGEMVARELANQEIEVKIQADEQSRLIFPPSHRVKLNVEKLYGLGWRPTYSLREMFMRMFKDLQERELLKS